VVKDSTGKEVGHVTSGTYSPVLKKGIGMMYVDQSLTK
jgi:glycine cleavage system aminomethyltransferase T